MVVYFALRCSLSPAVSSGDIFLHVEALPSGGGSSWWPPLTSAPAAAADHRCLGRKRRWRTLWARRGRRRCGRMPSRGASLFCSLLGTTTTTTTITTITKKLGKIYKKSPK